MTLTMYGIDRYAHDLVAKFCPKGVLNETHDMRTTAALGMERFFGEHLRLKGKKAESDYWRETWDRFVKIMDDSGIVVPSLKEIDNPNSESIRQVIDDLWNEDKFPTAHRKIALAVLIQLCDSMVWWAQRYKKLEPKNNRAASQTDISNTFEEENIL